MSTQLTVLGQTDIAKGGLGLGGSIFKLKPGNIELVQKMSRTEGAIPGKLRTPDGQHFSEMQVVLLFEPVEQRAYFEGEDFSKDSKICFSLDNAAPHEKAKVPQAMKCGYYDTKGYYVPLCPQASWEKWRKTKERKDLPKCKNYWHLVVADRVTRLPYYLNVKGTSIDPFVSAMQSVARLLGLMDAQARAEREALAKTDPAAAAAIGLPNVFDVSFKIYPVAENKSTYYKLGFKDFAPLKKEDRAAFGAIFLDFANRKVQVAADTEEAEALAAAEAQAAQQTVEAPATEAPAVNIGPGEIVI